MEIAAQGLEFPEGPVAMPDGSVLLVEVRGGWLTKVGQSGSVDRLVRLGGGPNGLAIGPDGAAYVCNNGGNMWIEVGGVWMPVAPAEDYVSGSIQRVDLSTGSVATLYTECAGRSLAGPNDIVFDAEGGFWFTDFGKEMGGSRIGGSVCYASCDGKSIRRAVEHFLSPNGIGLSPQGDMLYVSDTYSGRIYQRRIVSPGVLETGSSMMFPGELGFTVAGLSLLDSLAIQADGAVCVATIGNSGVTIGHGSHQTLIATPDPFPTNLCFGGSDMRTAWITGAATGVLLRTQWKTPGLKLNF